MFQILLLERAHERSAPVVVREFVPDCRTLICGGGGGGGERGSGWEGGRERWGSGGGGE